MREIERNRRTTLRSRGGGRVPSGSYDNIHKLRGVSEKFGVPYFRVLMIRILLFRVLYQGSYDIYHSMPSPSVSEKFFLRSWRESQSLTGFGV